MAGVFMKPNTHVAGVFMKPNTHVAGVFMKPNPHVAGVFMKPNTCGTQIKIFFKFGFYLKNIND